jgi:hypothetical protein
VRGHGDERVDLAAPPGNVPSAGGADHDAAVGFWCTTRGQDGCTRLRRLKGHSSSTLGNVELEATCGVRRAACLMLHAFAGPRNPVLLVPWGSGVGMPAQTFTPRCLCVLAAQASAARNGKGPAGHTFQGCTRNDSHGQVAR